MEDDGSQHRGDSPTLFEKCVSSLNWVSEGQGQRVAQTGDERPFSLTAPGSDPQPGIEPRPHW